MKNIEQLNELKEQFKEFFVLRDMVDHINDHTIEEILDYNRKNFTSNRTIVTMIDNYCIINSIHTRKYWELLTKAYDEKPFLFDHHFLRRISLRELFKRKYFPNMEF